MRGAGLRWFYRSLQRSKWCTANCVRLCYEGATRLLDTVPDRIGTDGEGDSRGVPGNSAQKRLLMIALLQCIAKEESAKPASAPAPLAAPVAPSPASGSPGLAGIAALLQVYLDGCLGFSPFIKYLPLPTCHPSLPAQFPPDQEHLPCREGGHRGAWDKRKDLVFEVAEKPLHCSRR